MAGVESASRGIRHLLLFLFLLFLLAVVIPGSQSKKHHHHRLRQHRANRHRHHEIATEIIELIEPSLSCHANMTATVRTGSYATVLVAEADPRDAKCRSQHVGGSINIDLKTDCRVQYSAGSVYNFTIIARRFPGIAVDADRKIPMKCTFYLTGAASGKWNVGDDPDIDTITNGGIVYAKDEAEDIDLYLDPAPVGDQRSAGDQPSSGDQRSAGNQRSAGDHQPAGDQPENVIHQMQIGQNEMHRDENSIDALPANMVASARRQLDVEEEEEEMVSPDGRIVFRPQKFWYLAPLVAAIVFVSIFILVVYVRQKERSRKLQRLSTKKRLAAARTPTLEDIRSIVAGEEELDSRQTATSGESAAKADPADVDVEQVAPQFD